MPPDRIASDEQAFAALAGDALFGRTGEVVFAAIVVVSVAGSLAAVLMASPRVYYAMARDGLFFPASRPSTRAEALPHGRSRSRRRSPSRSRCPAASTRSFLISWSRPWSSWR